MSGAPDVESFAEDEQFTLKQPIISDADIVTDDQKPDGVVDANRPSSRAVNVENHPNAVLLSAMHNSVHDMLDKMDAILVELNQKSSDDWFHLEALQKAKEKLCEVESALYDGVTGQNREAETQRRERKAKRARQE